MSTSPTPMFGNSSDSYVSLTLDHWNDAVAGILLPLTVVLVSYLVVGCFGNLSVIYVYWWQIRTPSKERYFIPILALVDMISCVISAGSGVYANLHPLKFESDIGCKMVAFLGVLFATISADLLVIIAVDRFLKICFPFGTQMTLYWKRVSLVAMFIVSTMIAIPALFVYGSVPVINPTHNLTGWRCVNVLHNGSRPMWELFYKALLFDYVMLRFIVLSIIYIRIGKVICKHFKRRASRHQRLCGSQSVSNGAQSCNQASVLPNDVRRESSFLERCCCRTRLLDRIASDLDSSRNGRDSTHSRRTERKGLKLTLMFMLITGIYIFTFGPKVVLMTFETMNERFWTTMTAGELVGFRFLYTLFIVNNVVNPFIYGFLDDQFRKELRKLCILHL
ncbi:probable G-protein coupled receptor 21 [Ylistrum balloti]|uniref:probable G-protein coupled receptor 21 n=1 Tax=Ylistrum balloti TaxID=509963 RepID=UPI0029058F36|nr:probable G-protein coupled receptor 21 [Ylistrum balloti]